MTYLGHLKESIKLTVIYCHAYFIAKNAFLWWEGKPWWIPSYTLSELGIILLTIAITLPFTTLLRQRLAYEASLRKTGSIFEPTDDKE